MVREGHSKEVRVPRSLQGVKTLGHTAMGESILGNKKATAICLTYCRSIGEAGSLEKSDQGQEKGQKVCRESRLVLVGYLKTLTFTLRSKGVLLKRFVQRCGIV